MLARVAENKGNQLWEWDASNRVDTTPRRFLGIVARGHAFACGIHSVNIQQIPFTGYSSDAEGIGRPRGKSRLLRRRKIPICRYYECMCYPTRTQRSVPTMKFALGSR